MEVSIDEGDHVNLTFSTVWDKTSNVGAAKIDLKAANTGGGT